MTTSFLFSAKSITCTNRLGRALANWLPNKITIGLVGTLGAGKTYLVQEICRHWGVDPEMVVSPTFTLCNEYDADRKVFHLDLYRLADEDDLFETGATEYFNEAAVVFAEWADRFPDFLPEDRLDIQIEIESVDERTFYLTSTNDALDFIALGQLLSS